MVTLNHLTLRHRIVHLPYSSTLIRVWHTKDLLLHIFSWICRKSVAVIIRNRMVLLDHQIILIIIQTRRNASGLSKHKTDIESFSRSIISNWKDIHLAHLIIWKLGKECEFNLITFSIFILCFSYFRNGGYESAPLIGKFCGTDIPTEIPSQANQMYIRFVSDFSRSMQGFEIQWDSTTQGKNTQKISTLFHYLLPFNS